MDQRAPTTPPTSGEPLRQRARATKLELAERLDFIDDLLRAGGSPSVVKRKVVTRYSCSERQAEKYMQAVYNRWRDQSRTDAPFRREKAIRMAEHHYAKSMSKEKYAAAAASLGQIIRMSGALSQHDPRRDERLDQLGPAPMEPGETLPYARRLLLLELEDVARNQALDPERRLRWIAELAGKLGMLYSRSEVEEQLIRVEAIVATRRELPPAAEIVDAKAAGWGENSTGRGSPRGPRPLPGSGAPPGQGQDGGDDPEGGGPVGSA